MPKRCNDFQDLVTLIQEALVPQGAKVTPSAMVPGPNSGTLREIDILIETPVGPYDIKIAVEAKDEGRKMDATKIETIIGKYRGRGSLVVNKVVVVAHRGFTEEAMNRARDEDIELLTLDEENICDRCKNMLPKQMNYHSDPMPYSFEIDPPLPAEIDRTVAMKEGHFVCTCHGHDKGTPMSWMFGIIINAIIPNKMIVGKMHEVAVNGKGRSILSHDMPVANHVFRYDGVDILSPNSPQRSSTSTLPAR
jgi:Restriction endonuclease